MRVVGVELRLVAIPLVRPFRTSFGEERDKRALLVRVETADGAVGWGECVASPDPRYSEEFIDEACLSLRHHLDVNASVSNYATLAKSPAGGACSNTLAASIGKSR